MYKIYLSEEDTADSIIEKIKNSSEPDIDIIIFSDSHLALSIVNLKLFKEIAHSLGKTFSVSTSDEAVKVLVEKAQIKLNTIPPKNNNLKKIFPPRAPASQSLGEIPLGRDNINMRNYNDTPKSVDSIGFSRSPAMPKRQFISKPMPAPAATRMPNECSPQDRDMAEFSVSKTNKRLFMAFVAFAVIVAGALAYVLLPTAQIAIMPKTEPMSTSFEMVLDKSAAELNKADKIVPASVIVADIEKSGQFTATGKKQITAKATGIATVYNEWSSFPQNLVASTRLLAANGKLFRTTKSVVVPGFIRDENGNDVPGSIDVPIIAAEAGPDYNIDPTDFTIPAFKGTSKFQKIYAKSSEATSGGASGFATVVSDTDLKKAKDFLEEEAKKDLLIQLEEKRPQDLVMLPEAVSTTSGNIAPSVKVDQVANKFKATLKTTASAFLFNPAYVNEIANELFVAIGQEKKIASISGSPTVEYSNVSIASSDKVKLTAAARTVGYSSVDAKLVKSKMLGKSKEEIGEYIKNSAPEIDKVKITLWPFWVKKVPTFERNVDVKILLDPVQ